ncbi:MAG: hypothetical protein V3U53_02210 [bacterium]
MKVRECFLQAVSIVRADDDAREAWASMNRKNAPWAAVRGEGGRLLGLLRGEEISGRVRAPETFLTAGELAAEDGPAALVESPARPPGVLELGRAKESLSGGD